VKEVFPEASVFKIGMYPLPMDKLMEFAASVKKLYVVEELDPVIENEVKAAGLKVTGKEIIPSAGEIFPHIIKNSILGFTGAKAAPELPPRPPVLCKGCGHIPVFEVLRDLDAVVLGDIGCYTLGALPPYRAMDTTVCMGASVGNEIGFRKAAGLAGKEIVSAAVIGDSTFYHSGMTGLLDALYNNTPITLIILDNRITAMTGHQPDAGTGIDVSLNETENIDLENIVRGLGVKRVKRVNAYKKEELKRTIEEEIAAGEVSVIIVDEICVIGETRLKSMKRKKDGASE
jgi:indolepyruvate ferredoxin oxidoreductase alpha subunit